MSSVTKIQKLLGFWQQDKENFAICRDILLCYASNNDAATAESFLFNLSDPLKQQPQLIRILAQTYMNAGKIAQAKDLFASMPEDEYHFRAYSLAMCLYFENQFVQAEALLSPLISAHSSELAPEFFVLFARVHYQLGNIDLAYQHAKNVLNCGEEPNAELLGLLAMLALDQNKLDEARDFSSRGLEKAPSQHDALLAKASYLLQIQDMDSCEALCKEGLVKFPNSGRFWLVLSQVKMLEKNLPQAYTSIQKASELMPEHIGTWHIKAWCELMLNQIPQARISFEQALELNRNFADSHGGLAVVCFHEGDIHHTEKLAKTALRLDPQSFSGRFAMSLLARKQGNTGEADKLIQDILNQESHLQGTSHSQLVQLLQA